MLDGSLAPCRYPNATRRAVSSSGSTVSPGWTMIGSVVVASGSEALEQPPHAGDDDGRAALRVAEPPQQLEPLAQRLDGRADPLERQRLPGREHRHLVGRQELRRGRPRAGPPSWSSAWRRRGADGWTTRPARRSRWGAPPRPRPTGRRAHRALGSAPVRRAAAGGDQPIARGNNATESLPQEAFVRILVVQATGSGRAARMARCASSRCCRRPPRSCSSSGSGTTSSG